MTHLKESMLRLSQLAPNLALPIQASLKSIAEIAREELGEWAAVDDLDVPENLLPLKRILRLAEQGVAP